MTPPVLPLPPPPSSTNPTVSRTDSPSNLPTASTSEMLNYLWIPLLFTFLKDLTPAKAQSGLLLPSAQPELDSTGLGPSCPSPDLKLNYRPVIGILSHPGDGASGRLNNGTNTSYIAASYVKFVESAGARVIPLIYNEPPEILYQKLDLVNGVLFTGGWAKRGLYFEVATEIFQKVLERNDKGDNFPLLAICLGFELLTMIITKDGNILEEFNAVDQASTVQFMENINVQGTVFERFIVMIASVITSVVSFSPDFGVVQMERVQIGKLNCWNFNK